MGSQKPAVIITGASRGIGAAVANWLAKTGAAIALVARSRADLESVAENVLHLGGDPLVCPGDVADYEACRLAVDATLKRFGRLDAVINNAGIVQPVAPIARVDPDRWRYNIEVNLMGVFFMSRAAVCALREHRGRIVNVSSGAANLVLESVSAYCAAKAALNHFTRVMAAEEPGLTVLAVRPGVVDTRMQEDIRREAPRAMPSGQAAYYRQLKEHHELEPPEVPARSIAWLALYAPPQFSGRFLDHDDPRISVPSLEAFGGKFPFESMP